jgi:hypothetical protein
MANATKSRILSVNPNNRPVCRCICHAGVTNSVYTWSLVAKFRAAGKIQSGSAFCTVVGVAAAVPPSDGFVGVVGLGSAFTTAQASTA